MRKKGELGKGLEKKKEKKREDDMGTTIKVSWH